MKILNTNLKDTNLIWIDLEMTGLNPDADRILEIATIVTDHHLNVLAEGPVVAIQQSQARLDEMDAWNTEHHAKSGLIQRVRESPYNEAIAETQTLDFLAQYVPPNKSPMCGNSICQDRRFLWRYMPNLERYFHYRHVDVSTIKVLAQYWAPKIAAGFSKASTHLALQDIRDSIEELKYYRTHFLKLTHF